MTRHALGIVLLLAGSVPVVAARVVKLYRDSSDLKAEYSTCMPKQDGAAGAGA